MTSNDSTEAAVSILAESPSPQTFLERHGITPILFAFISLVLIFLLYQGIGGIITFLFFGMNLTKENVQGFRIATLLGQLLLLLLPALFLTRLAAPKSTSFLRLHVPRIRDLVIPFFGIFSLQQMLQVYMVFQERIPLPKSLQSVVEQFKQLIETTYKLLAGSSSLPELMFVVLVIALVPAVAEEVVFRGLIQRCFEQGLGGMKGVLLTALIFALYHLNPFSFIPLIGLGFYLGFLVYRSNNLWISVAGHFYNNVFAVFALYWGMEENYVVTGNPDALSVPALFLTFVSFSVAFFISTYYFIQRTKQQPSPTES